jgi:hypothetical protein
MDRKNKDKTTGFPAAEPDDLSSHAHRQLIGYIGLAMPLLLWLIAGFRPIAGLAPWQPLDSVSAYYYSGAVSAFAGILTALALFLFSYKGYDNKYRRRDRIAAIVAGCAALLVAFFPVGAPPPFPVPPWWSQPVGLIHGIGAVILFGTFIFYCLFLFPRSSTAKGQPLPRDKQWRNGIYIFCGLGILGCMIWAIRAMSAGRPIFLPEALALEFFAVSWLVKGRAIPTAIHYIRHPKELAQDAIKAIDAKPAPVPRPSGTNRKSVKKGD